MTDLNFQEFCKLAEDRFGIELRIVKSKAGHEMMELYMSGQHLCCGDITGPDAGYSCSFGPYHALTIFGWAYAFDGDHWHLLPDGMVGWRHGSNPFPQIPEHNWSFGKN